jgi:hypothetical protein
MTEKYGQIALMSIDNLPDVSGVFLYLYQACGRSVPYLSDSIQDI